MKVLEERKEYTIFYDENWVVAHGSKGGVLALGGCYYIPDTNKVSDMFYCKCKSDNKADTIEALGRLILKKMKKELK